MTGPTHADLMRDFGRMEGRFDAVEDHLEKIDTTLERIDQRLARIEQAEDQRKGAWSLGHWLYGAATGLAAFLAAHFLK